jgi:hypothetical protein
MTDAGLRFFATITTQDAQSLSRETEDRGVLLDWLHAHYESGDALTITIEATGEAALKMVAALQFGLIQMRKGEE